MTDKNTCCGYPVHEAAALFPLLPESELKELAEDIKERGLINPVILHGKQLLDGRNRLLACELAGVGPYFKDYTHWRIKHSPTEYVLATNSKRRQLTPSEKATIAAEAVPLIKNEIEQERRRGISEARNGETSAPGRESKQRDVDNNRKATARAAKAVGASTRSVERARRLKEKAPSVFADVKAGKKTVKAATRELGWERPRQEPDPPAIIKREWLKCTKQQKTDLLKWQSQHME